MCCGERRSGAREGDEQRDIDLLREYKKKVASQENKKEKEVLAKPTEETEKETSSSDGGKKEKVRRRKNRKRSSKKNKKAREGGATNTQSKETTSTPETKAETKKNVEATDGGGWVTASYKKKKKKKSQRGQEGKGGDSTSITTETGVSSPKSKSRTNEEAEEQTTESVSVPSKALGGIIGKGGATLHAIQDKTGTKINTPSRKVESEDDKRRKGEIPALNDQDTTSTITITGPKNGVKIAKDSVLQIAKAGYCRLLNPEMKEGFTKVPANTIGEIVGSKGRTMKALQDAFKVKIRLPSPSERRSAKKTDLLKVYFVGEKRAIRDTKDAIKSLLQFHWSEKTHVGQTYQEVAVAESQLHKVIGKGGQIIKSIQGDTKTKIHMPSKTSANQNVIIVGTAANIAKAQARIKQALEREPQQVVYADEEEGAEEDEEGY
eukprot:g4127.t1